MVQKSCCKLFCCTLPNLLLQPNSETPQWLDSCKLAALLSWEFASADRKQQAMQQIPMPSTTSTAAAQLDTSLAALLAELYC